MSRKSCSLLRHRNVLLANATLSVAFLFLLLQIAAVPVSAQQPNAQAGILHHPDVNYSVHFDVSPPLRDMATQVSKERGGEVEHPVLYPKLQQLMEAAQQGKKPLPDGALQTTALPPVNATIGLNLLGVGNGFGSYVVPDAPPDVNLAVGDTQVLQWVNVSYAVFDKTTGAVIAGPILGNAFWKGFGGQCESNNSGDIIAQWDKVAHRWVATQNVFSSPYMTCVAISTTSDATGTYFRFAFPQPGFPDYPKWGIWPDAYYQSQNNFGPQGAGYVGAYACAYERAKMLVGDSTAKQICFQTGTFDDSLLAGDLDSAASLPPTGEPEVFVGSIDNGTGFINVYQYLFHVDFTTPANSTFTGAGGTMPISGVASFNLACGGNGACVPQPSPGELLDSLGDRLMYRLAYRNFSGDHQAWLVSHSVTAGSSVGERWYEFRAPETSTSLSVYQQGTFAPDSKYRWMGSIAMDQAQDILLGYSVSSSSVFPSINYTGRVATDPLGTMETEASIIAGAGAQFSTANRWGDYTSMAIDAADDCTFWYTDEYYMLTASFDWSTRLASAKFPGCGVAGVSLSPGSFNFGSQAINTSSSPQPFTLTNNQSSALMNISISFTGSNSGDFKETDNCGTSILANSSCTINVTFTPTGYGNRSATLSVSDSAGTQTSGLSGVVPPTTQITAPLNGATVSGTVTVTATATDTVGIASIQIYIDGALKASGTSSPLNYSWNTGSVANGKHTIYSKATDTLGNTATSSTVTVTVSNSTSTNLVQNGGFESGNLNSWTAGGVLLPTVVTGHAHSGKYSAQLGAVTGTEPNGDSSVYQTVTIPASATTANLYFWYWSATTDNINNDWQEAQIQDASGNTLKQVMKVCTNNQKWVEVLLNVIAYRGKTIRIYFNVHENGNGNKTYMYLDDVGLWYK